MSTLDDLRAVAPYIDSSLQPTGAELPALLAALCYKLDGLNLEDVVTTAKVEESVETGVTAKVSDTISPPAQEEAPAPPAPPASTEAPPASPVAPPPSEAGTPSVPPTSAATDAGGVTGIVGNNPAGWSATVSSG